VSIFGEEHQVRARVESMENYSSHADYKEILKYLDCQNRKKVKEIFLVHGEPDVQHIFRQHLIDRGFNARITIPALGESFTV
jgi:metallo-beta-lactamase family protein